MLPSSTGKPKTAAISARLDEVDLARLAERAERADRSLSAELRQAVRFYLAQPATERAA